MVMALEVGSQRQPRDTNQVRAFEGSDKGPEPRQSRMVSMMWNGVGALRQGKWASGTVNILMGHFKYLVGRDEFQHNQPGLGLVLCVFSLLLFSCVGGMALLDE